MRVSKAETPAPGHVQVDLRRHRPNNRTELSPETGILIPYRVVKRLRVFTLQVDVATTPSELMESADMETIFALLTHKILRSVNNDGPAEAQLLLQDWCIFLCAHYNRHTFGQRRIDAADVDTTFCKCEPLLFPPPSTCTLSSKAPPSPAHLNRHYHPHHRPTGARGGFRPWRTRGAAARGSAST